VTREARRGKNKKSHDTGADGTGQESTAPFQQVVDGTDRALSEEGRLLPHEKECSIPNPPGLVPTSTDSKPTVSEKSQTQPRQGDGTALIGANPAAAHIPDPSPTPTKKGRRGQLPGPDTTHEPDGQIFDTNSAIIGFLEFTNIATSSQSRGGKSKFRRSMLHTLRTHRYSEATGPELLYSKPRILKDHKSQASRKQQKQKTSSKNQL